jgi:Protein of unknown function (DUF2934)
MQTELETQIRERAYHLWVADGCRDGEADKHWLAAERDVLAAFASSTPAPKARTARRPANVASVAKAPAKARRPAP